MSKPDITRTSRAHEIWSHENGRFETITNDLQIRATVPLTFGDVTVQFRPGQDRWGVKLASGEWRSMSAAEMDALVMLREVIREHQGRSN